ncbi:Piwi-domain-containing protein [Polyplosphaeria fusca]|uniref:Piwi-domain-containing protein n=1 Tax=Polyplosphaeria fusca TaxID=682080 RepID=A0A9P4QQ47_9PLEO|nr:Piwi-domain-containing protein [Polyplosphaeria fusca]
MAGPPKNRPNAEKGGTGSSNSQAASGRDGTQRSTPKSIPRLDGNRDPKIPEGRAPADYSKATDLKNISEMLGMHGWYIARGFTIPDGFVTRPKKFNNQGKEISVKLNTFNVLQAPSTTVHQYDVSWGKTVDPTKRQLVKKIWASKAVKSALGEPQNLWIYDGNKLAWSGKRIEREEIRLDIDLDAEENEARKAAGQEPRAARGRENKHKIYIKYTRTIDFGHLDAYLAGSSTGSPEVIDSINFLDHLLREAPSQNYTQIKKSFFQRGEQRFDLGGGIEAFKGVFASLRPALTNDYKKALTVNVDVANGTFWRVQPLARALLQAFNTNDLPSIQARFVKAKTEWKRSLFRKDLARFKRVGVTTTHNPKNPQQFTIDELCGKDPYETIFVDKDVGEISVAEYFRTKYNKNLTRNVPIVKMTKKIGGRPVYLPLEFLQIDPNQRYNSKLSDQQTSQMIKFAVTLPAQRWTAVEHGVRLLDWQNDRYLKHYGLKVSQTASNVKARLLPSPKVLFGGTGPTASVPPKDLIQGRWRLDGRKFISSNQRDILSWGVCFIGGRGALNKPQVDAFITKFIQIYESHGGRINPKFGKQPHIMEGNLARGGDMIADVFNATGNKFQARPTFLMFIVNDRNVDVYRRIKKSCDCRYGLVSQVMQSRHVATAQPQYISNVCMKVNAKHGGATCYTKSDVIGKVAPNHNTIPTMVVGADVSHPAPGAGSDSAASFAAITMSIDSSFTRYLAECNTNGNRVEMVTTDNIDKHLGNMAKKWMQRLGRGLPPKRVLYIRDGVSEGQYAAVLEQEVRDMKECFFKLGCKDIPKFTVVIAGKRHHIRFFPDKNYQDRNGNPLPGTLVEAGCTHPFEFDWYMCSHVAIKGTARPIHYQCILNEGEWSGMELQSFIFEHSYQYVRSTTPVSLHPAVYYAHLAADRSRAHLNETVVSSGKKETKAEVRPASSSGSSKDKVEIQPLIPLSNAAGLMEAMWYI